MHPGVFLFVNIFQKFISPDRFKSSLCFDLVKKNRTFVKLNLEMSIHFVERIFKNFTVVGAT